MMGAKWGKNSGTRGQETTSTVVATRALSLQVKNISNYLASILLLIVLCLSLQLMVIEIIDGMIKEIVF